MQKLGISVPGSKCKLSKCQVFFLIREKGKCGYWPKEPEREDKIYFRSYWNWSYKSLVIKEKAFP